MNILCVSDLHYSLRQFDWLARSAGGYDLVVIAGDMMELGSHIDTDTQAAVMERYFRKICAQVPLVVCSGNHDLVDEGDGTRTTEWLADLAIPGLAVDLQCYENDKVRILSLPWWESNEERESAGEWLQEKCQSRNDCVEIWVYHVPPKDTKTSWNGKQDLGDPWIVDRIKDCSPDLVLAGHIHNAPYYPDGSWTDRIGKTVVTNGGRMTGEVPASIVIQIDKGKLTWYGMEGSEEATFR